MYNDKVSASNKIERWKVSLSEYDIVWEYIEGKDNVVADCLSRVIDTGGASEDPELDQEPLSVLVMSELTGEKTSDWHYNTIKTHHSPCHFNAHDTLKSLHQHKLEWNGMEAQVKAFAESCKLCQMIKTRTHTAHSASYSMKSEKPGEKISFDIMEYDEDFYGFGFILVIVDCFHSYTTLIPLRTIKVGEIYHSLIQYFCNDGIPDLVVHDLGASLNAVDIKSLMAFLNINQIVTNPRNSQENGIAEKKISQVRQVIKLLIEESSTQSAELAWSLIVPFAQRALNIMTGSTGYSPAEIRFGAHNRLDAIKEMLVPAEIAEQQAKVIAVAKQNLLLKKAKKDISKLSVFKPNELVIIKNPVHLKRNVSHKPYLGPFKVVGQDNLAVTVTLAADPTIIRKIKISEVFRFKDNVAKLDEIGTVPGLKLVPSCK